MMYDRMQEIKNICDMTYSDGVVSGVVSYADLHKALADLLAETGRRHNDLRRYTEGMTPQDYQREANMLAAQDLPDELTKANVGLGLAGEAGEAADVIKKHLCQGHPLDLAKLKNELGDVLWYVARGCDVFGFQLEDVMAENISKLKNRYKSGKFSVQDSLNRKE